MPESEARAVGARLDWHLYAERLDRQAERCASDLADARLLEAWCDIDDHLRSVMPGDRLTRLGLLGVIAAPDRRDVARRSVMEREADLAAIHHAQMIVQERIDSQRIIDHARTADALTEYPQCPKCDGKGCADTNARHLTRCDHCEGTGNAPAADPEYHSVVMIVDVSTPEGDAFLHNVAESTDAVVHVSAFSTPEDDGDIVALDWLERMGNVHREQAAADLADYELEG